VEKPLIAACKAGHVSVVRELVKAGADVNLRDGWWDTPLVAACRGGHVSVVEDLVKAGADVNLQFYDRNTPLIAACMRGHVSVLEELMKAGADVNLQGRRGDTPLKAAVRKGSLSTVKCLVEHGAHLVNQVVDIKVSAVYRALILNKPDIVKYLIEEQNRISPGQFTGNVHLFNSLVKIRHAGVATHSSNDVVVTDSSVWCMDRGEDVWSTIRRGEVWEIIGWEDCDVLRHLLCVGLDVSQSVQLYSEYRETGVRPLLYTLIDEKWVDDRTEKVRILLEEGVDVNVRVRYREYDSVLDRGGVTVLERTRRLVCQYSKYRYYRDRVTECLKVSNEIKKHVRRYSI
jgi:hypothetical protein